MIDWKTVTIDDINKMKNKGAATSKTNVKNTDDIENLMVYLYSKTKTNGDKEFDAGDIIKKITPLCEKIDITDIEEIANIYDSFIQGYAEYNSKNIIPYVKKEEYSENTLSEARKLYESGKFIDFVTETWNKGWYKDTHIIQFVLLQGASNFIINAEDGLHLYVEGDTGLGKSASVQEALSYLQPTMQVTSKFTAQWLYYGSKNNRLTGKQIVFTDDTTFSEEIAGNMRNILSEWLKGVTKDSVGKDGEPTVLTVPARTTLILTSVDGIVQKTNEGQDESRYTTMKIHRTKDDVSNIKKFMQTPKPDVSHEKEVIRAVWSLMTDINVEVPFTFDKIDVYTHKSGQIEESLQKHDLSFRELKKYRTMLMANALLHNRTIVNEDDIKEVGRILSYCNFMIKNDTPGFNKTELLLKEIFETHSEYLSIAELTEYSKLNQNQVYTALRGKFGKFDSPTGGIISKGVNLDIIKDAEGRYRLKLKSKTEIKIQTIETPALV